RRIGRFAARGCSRKNVGSAASLQSWTRHAVAARRNQRTNQNPNRRSVKKGRRALREINRWRVAGGSRRIYKALTESIYIQRRAMLVEVLVEFWSDVLRACSNIARRDLPTAKKETAALAERFTAPEVLRRIQRLEELRDNLGRNIQEALAFEVAFLEVFGSCRFPGFSRTRRFPRTFREKRRNTLLKGDLIGITQ